MSEVFKEGYFTEECPLWPGRALSVRIEEVLASEETDYQLLEIFRGEGFGKMLALDGKIQLAESDEFIYHEMFVHVPCFSHPEPENVLVIGGGDGGVVRELLKHSCIEHIDLCELDEEVVLVQGGVGLGVRRGEEALDLLREGGGGHGLPLPPLVRGGAGEGQGRGGGVALPPLGQADPGARRGGAHQAGEQQRGPGGGGHQ